MGAPAAPAPQVALTAWRHLAVEPGSHLAPGSLPEAGWRPFTAPGLFGPDAQGRLAESLDHWLEHRLDAPLDGHLRFEGLASFCDLFIDGALAATHRSMFVPLEVPVKLAAGARLHLRFLCLDDALRAAPRRARWRPLMIEPHGLRFIRTTALGSMDGWTPPGRPTGPYRAITAQPAGPLRQVRLAPRLEGDTGHLAVSLTLAAGLTPRSLRLSCAGGSIDLAPAGAGDWAGTLVLAQVARWWPHTHGTPVLHQVQLTLDDVVHDLGMVGFRSIEVDRGADGRGFGLIINGEPVFCRGAVWMTPDITRLPGTREACQPLLEQARAAGLNMLRVPGVGVYESAEFFAACDALGLLVWQDAMLANFDYPQQDEAFLGALGEEVTHLLERTRAHPSLAVFCGGSEVFQQAAMLGAPPEDWSGPVFDDLLPGLVARLNPHLPYVPNSPCGGALPFLPEEGVSHYFGVGAYRRPLDDARLADVRFASECLAFAHVPDDPALMQAGVPRDAGADWDFADVRDHYTRLLFGETGAGPARAHALAEACGAAVLERTMALWRRVGSSTRGALLLALSDLAPGAGWGLIDHQGQPKAAYYGLARACAPLHLSLTDEGVNGLHLNLVNETAQSFAGVLSLKIYRDGRVLLREVNRTITLAPRESLRLSAFALLGGFFDLTYAYRFGAREHDGVVARLSDAQGALCSEAFYFPDTADIAPRPLGLRARLEGTTLVVETDRLARFVRLRVPGYRPADNLFHLAPGTPRRMALSPCRHDAPPPRGSLRALNGEEEVRFGP